MPLKKIALKSGFNKQATASQAEGEWIDWKILILYTYNFMFYIWHTLLVLLFIAFAFFMGYKLGKSKQENKQENKQEKGSCPFFNDKNFS